MCVQQTNFQIYLQLSDMISLAKNDLSVEKKFHICYIGNYATYDIPQCVFFKSVKIEWLNMVDFSKELTSLKKCNFLYTATSLKNYVS